MKRGFKAAAERRAVAARRKLGLRDIDPLPARKLAKRLGFGVVGADALPGLDEACARHLCLSTCGWSALLLANGSVRLIVYNSGESPARQESSIMHELAHLLCKHDSSTIDFGGGLLLRRFVKEHEDEAAWFGGCLQLPKVALEQHIIRGASVYDVASHFTASRDMVLYRYRMTGLQRQYPRPGWK